MSISIITAPKKTSWRITVEEVVDALRKKWPDARIRFIDDEHFRIDFIVDIDGLPVLGNMEKIAQSLGIECPFGPELAQFALWFRSLVPPEQPLVLMDDCYNYVIPLTPRTTVEDIVTYRTAIEPWSEGEEPPDDVFR